MNTPDKVLGVINPNTPRRIAATGMLGLLGLILIYVAAATPPASPGWLFFLIVFGAGCLYLAWQLWQVTGVPLELTHAELREQGGRVLCRVENIALVDRGLFAFKPATGFQVKLKEPARGFVYVPGLWWRTRRLLMVGGVTSRAEAKSVADLITALLVERDRAP
ncbi:MAG: hypothetical protein GDA52_05715 [Rhodobacteraceae bacterium]|nr:hypothetical protein [Paracoccaceae bacterium]